MYKLLDLIGQTRLYKLLEHYKMPYRKILLKLNMETEIAFVELMAGEMLKYLHDKQILNLGDRVVATTVKIRMTEDIANRLEACGFYELALELQEWIKQSYKSIHEYNKIVKPLQKEVEIYRKMSGKQIQEPATYFRVSFFGAGHLETFRNKHFILRTKGGKRVLKVHAKLKKKFDKDLKFIFSEDIPTDEETLNGMTKKCQVVKVYPLTFKEINSYNLDKMQDENF